MSAEIGLHNIAFPVYKIGRTAPITEDGVSFILLGKNLGDENEQYKMLIIDDKNVDGHSLASRRLKLKAQNVGLFNLHTAIFFISDLIKLATGDTWFIDSEGSIFEYTKSRRVRLVYKEITRIIPISSGGAIIEVRGVPGRFKTLHTPDMFNTKYAGLLVVGIGYILYGLYDKKYDDTYRVI